MPAGDRGAASEELGNRRGDRWPARAKRRTRLRRDRGYLQEAREGKELMRKRAFFLVVMVFASASLCGCAVERPDRETLGGLIQKMCRARFQCRVTCRAEGQTLWVYLPYTSGRQGQAGTKAEPKDLFVEYSI